MRRIIPVLLAALLFVSSAAAESPFDLSAMSLTELVELHTLVDTEIDVRIGCEPTEFPAGIYVGGVSIKTGSYVIYTDDDCYGDVGLFANMETYQQAMANEDESLALYHSYLGFNQSTYVHIEEGTVLFTTNEMRIKQATADWMP